MSLFVQKQGKGASRAFVRVTNRFGGENSDPDNRYSRRCKLQVSERALRLEDRQLCGSVVIIDDEIPNCPFLGAPAPQNGSVTIEDSYVPVTLHYSNGRLVSAHC
jgi:hypothetical protein